jgi:hypothetical protein
VVVVGNENNFDGPLSELGELREIKLEETLWANNLLNNIIYFKLHPLNFYDSI